MDMISETDFDDLVGAYVLDACDADERSAVEEYARAHPDAAREIERLRSAAVWLAASDAVAPPPRALRGLVDRARDARPVGVAGAWESYRSETDRLHTFLTGFDRRFVDSETCNGLTVTELVLHLAAAERAIANELDQPTIVMFDDAYLREITAAELVECAGVDFDGAVARWWSAVETVRERARGAHHRVGGYRINDALMIRAFETWTHVDDLRAVSGLEESTPTHAVLRAMVEFSVRSTPLALASTGRARDHGAALLHLTGAIDGEWTIPLVVDDGGAARDGNVVTIATLTIDTVDWCKRFAARRDDGVAHFGAGDETVVRDLVLAAPAFAGL